MNLNSGLSEADAANFYAVAATSVGVAALCAQRRGGACIFSKRRLDVSSD